MEAIFSLSFVIHLQIQRQVPFFETTFKVGFIIISTLSMNKTKPTRGEISY